MLDRAHNIFCFRYIITIPQPVHSFSHRGRAIRRFAVSPTRPFAVSPLYPPAFFTSTTRSVASGSKNGIGSRSELRTFQRAKSTPLISVCFQVGSTEICSRSVLVTMQTADGELLMKCATSDGET